MQWLALACAIILEVAGTTCLKLSDGLTRPLPSVLIFVFYGLSFAAIALAMKKLELSHVYAVWAALGLVLVTIIGIVHFKEPAGAIKLGSMALIVAGVIGLHLSGAHN